MTDTSLLKAACAIVNVDPNTLRAHRITPQYVTLIADNFRKFKVSRDELPVAETPARSRKKPAARKK